MKNTGWGGLDLILQGPFLILLHMPNRRLKVLQDVSSHHTESAPVWGAAAWAMVGQADSKRHLTGANLCLGGPQQPGLQTGGAVWHQLQMLVNFFSLLEVPWSQSPRGSLFVPYHIMPLPHPTHGYTYFWEIMHCKPVTGSLSIPSHLAIVKCSGRPKRY